MIDVLGTPQSLLLLGGTSEIALAIARRYASPDRELRVVLAARPTERRAAAVLELKALNCTVTEVDLEGRDAASHAATIDRAFFDGDIDVAVIAFGVLGDQERAWLDPELALELAEVNFAAPVHLGVMLAAKMREQGHGRIVALSSVAGERVRRSNFVYGATKAGFDGFFLGLGEALREHDISVLVVRPGFVKTKMTADREPIPLAVTPDEVAEAVAVAVRDRKDLIWVPASLRAVMSGLRHVPRPMFRRLPV